MLILLEHTIIHQILFFMGEFSVGRLNLAVKGVILEAVFREGSFTIPDIAAQTGFSVTTVAKYVAELCTDKVLQPVDSVRSGRRGRRPNIYRIASDSYCFLGVDIKTFELTIGLMNLSGEMVRIEHITDFCFENTHNKLDEICTHISRFMSESESRHPCRIVGANFNLGGRVNSRQGTSATIFNFEETREIPLTTLLGEYLGIPVFIENDTKAMAYGEYASAGKELPENMLYVNVGWGLGLCIIINGEIYYGKDGYSGEFGHIHMYNNNVMCHCGKKGCIETEISGSAICRKLIERIHNHEVSVLSRKVWDGGVITIADILEAMKLEDPLCIELVSQAGSELGHQLAGLINLLNPDCIVIGGSVAGVAPYYFLQPAKLAIHKYSLRLMNQHLAIQSSRLGADAGVIGACMIARRRVIWDRLLK